MNVEYLPDVFTTIDANSSSVWDVCTYFISHLAWHKKRLTILGPKIEGLPDDHRSKPSCLFELSRLFHSVGNYMERKRLLTRALTLWREPSRFLSETNWYLGLYEGGIKRVEDASQIHKRLGDMAESHAIILFTENGNQLQVCNSQHFLGQIYQFKREIEKAIHHYEAALGIASSFNWHKDLHLTHCPLANLLLTKGRFYDAQTHAERAKSHAVNPRDEAADFVVVQTA